MASLDGANAAPWDHEAEQPLPPKRRGGGALQNLAEVQRPATRRASVLECGTPVPLSVGATCPQSPTGFMEKTRRQSGVSRPPAMIIVRQASELNAAGRPVCLAIGMFDGVHLGHQQVIRQAVSDA